MGLIKIALGFLPGWGWLASLGATLLELAGKVIGAALRGVTVIVANPVTLVTVGFIAMAAFSTGLVMGTREGRVRVASMTKERDHANRQAQDRLKDALAAREAAEAAEARRAADIASLASQPPAAVRAEPKPQPRRVQQPAKPAPRPGLCLPGFPTMGLGCE